MIRPTAISLLLLAALAGCASKPIYTGPTRYVASVPCADSLSALVAEDLPPRGKDDRPLLLEFGSGTPCMRNDNGEPRPVRLFSLADVSAPSEILVTVSGRNPVTLAPLLRMLGPDLAEIATYPFERFAKRSMDYSLSLFINSMQPRVAYLWIGTDDAWLGKESLDVAGRSRTSVWSTGVVTGAYTYGYEEKTSSTFSDVGSFTLSLKRNGSAQ